MATTGNAEAVLDIRTNSASFLTDITKNEKAAAALGKTFSQVGKTIEDAGGQIGSTVAEIGGHIETMVGHASKFASVFGLGSAAAVTGTVAIAAGIVATVAAMHELADNAAHVGAALDDMSETSGVAVEKLSGFKFAADVTGTSLESINNAIFKFQQRLGENSADVSRGLQRIGLSFTEIAKLEPDQQFLEIASAFKQITSPAQRAAAAVEIFGKQGRDLLPLLSKDLEGLVEKSQQLGFTWSEQDAKAAEQFEEKSNELRATLQNVATVIGKDLIPAFSIALDVSNWTLAKLLTEGPPAETIEQLREIALIIKGIQASWDLVAGNGLKPPRVAAPGGFGGVQPSVIGSSESVGRAIAEQASVTKDLTQRMAEAKKEAKEFADQQAKLALAAEKLAESWAKLDPGRATGRGSFAAQLDQFASHEIDISDLAESFELMGNEIVVTSDDITKDFVPAMATLGAHTEFVTKQMGELEQAIRSALGDVARELLTGLGGDIFGAIQAVTQRIATAIETILVDAVQKAVSSAASVINGLTVRAAGATGALAGLNAALRGSSFSGAAAAAGIAGVGAAATALGSGAAIGGALALGAATAGIGLAAVGAIYGVKKLIDAVTSGIGAMGAAVREVKKVLEDLSLQKQAFDDLDATIKKYKFSIEELGPALQRQQLDKQAQEIFHDWQVLTAGGLDMLAIMRELGGSIQELVSNALKFHLALPEALRPIIQQMIDAGKLTDDLGNKITNLDDSGLTFTESLSQGFSDLIKSVNDLVRVLKIAFKISGNVGDAISRAAAAAAAAAQAGSSSSGTGGGDNGNNREAAGDYLHLMRPRRFLAGEAGREDVVFGGAGRNLARDVAVELARIMPTPSAAHMGATGWPSTINMVVDGKTVAHATLDNLQGAAKSKFDVAVKRAQN